MRHTPPACSGVSSVTLIVSLKRSVTLLGFSVSYYYKLLKKSNAKRIWKRLGKFELDYKRGTMNRAESAQSLKGWLAYAKFAKTYKLRKMVSTRFNEIFADSFSSP